MPSQDNSHLTESESNRLIGFTNEEKYLRMIRNRPHLYSVGCANKRVLAQRNGSKIFAFGFFAITLLGLAVNNYQEVHSLSLYDTRKKFTFKSDPYSGTVKCTTQQVPYSQHGY